MSTSGSKPPVVSPISAWRNYKHNYGLYGYRCVACKKIYYPKKHLCSCGSQNFESMKLSGNGKLITFTQINNPPEAFEEMAPYCIGIVELEEGVRILAQITDAMLEDLSIGMPVKAVFRKLYARGEKGVIQYGVKFEPN